MNKACGILLPIHVYSTSVPYYRAETGRGNGSVVKCHRHYSWPLRVRKQITYIPPGSGIIRCVGAAW